MILIRSLLDLNFPLEQSLVDLNDQSLNIIRRARVIESSLDMFIDLRRSEVRVDEELVSLEIRRGVENLIEVHETICNRLSRVSVWHFGYLEGQRGDEVHDVRGWDEAGAGEGVVLFGVSSEAKDPIKESRERLDDGQQVIYRHLKDQLEAA